MDPKNTDSPVMALVRDNLERFLAKRGFEVLADGNIHNKLTDRAADANTLVVLFDAECMDLIDPGATGKRPVRVPSKLKRELAQVILAEYRERALNEISAGLKYDSTKAFTARAGLTKWLKSVLWREPTALELAVILHFIHQVKRKLFGLKVNYHMMPIFVAAQKTGKTESIKWLLSPLGHLSIQWPLSALEDERNTAKHETAYVMFFDELAWAERTDMKHLKSRITDSEISGRILGTNVYKTYKQNTTFIGASNQPIIELLRDSTGMRRFFEFSGPNMALRNSYSFANRAEFWALKDGIDPADIWRGVDESETLLPEFSMSLEKLEEVEEGLRDKDTVEEFWEEAGYKKTADEYTPGVASVNLTDLYREYRRFCEENGYARPKTSKGFSRGLSALGLTKHRKNSGVVFLIEKQSPTEIEAANIGMKLLNLQKIEGDKDGTTKK